MKKKLQTLKLGAIAVALLILCIALLTAFLWLVVGNPASPQIKKDDPKVVAEQANSNNEVSNVKESPSPLDPLGNLPSLLQIQEEGNLIEVSKGFFLVNSVVSNGKDKIAYTEMSNCLKDLNRGRISYNDCPWELNLKVWNKETNTARLVFSDKPSPVTFNFLDLLIKPVVAGGCRLTKFPIHWSKNDQKLILVWGNPTTCGSGGMPDFYSYLIDANGGEIKKLSRYQPLFTSDYEQVVYLEESDLSPRVCGPVVQKNEAKIVIKDIDTQTIKTLLEEPDTFYELKKIDEQKKTISFESVKVKRVKYAGWEEECANEDYFRSPKESRSISY